MNIHIKSVLCALVFSLLFYSKGFGLNVFIISIVVCILTATHNKEKPIPWLFVLAYFFCGLMVFVSPSTLTILAYLASLVVLIGKSIAIKSSTYVAGLMGVVSISMASVGNFIEATSKGKSNTSKQSRNTFLYLKGLFIALILVFLFATMYRKANPIFADFLMKIDLSFINIYWLLFTIVGYFIFQHILRPYHSEELVKQDAELPNHLSKPNTPFSKLVTKKLKNEITLGSIIFAALNLLLIFFLITDVTYLFQLDITENIAYSKSVHQGVYALVFSIVCAIAIILYFFRGNLNFYKKNKPLLYLTYLWIGLNLILTLITCYKNYSYVAELGLTYKRIGVFVYLLLVLGGLITAGIKVAQQKNFWFLFRSNTTIIFMLLILSSAIPWDNTITKYNLKNLENPDIEYLMELNNSNSKILQQFKTNHSGKLTTTQIDRITNRYDNYLTNEASKSWQEFTLISLTKNY